MARRTSRAPADRKSYDAGLRSGGDPGLRDTRAARGVAPADSKTYDAGLKATKLPGYQDEAAARGLSPADAQVDTSIRHARRDRR